MDRNNLFFPGLIRIVRIGQENRVLSNLWESTTLRISVYISKKNLIPKSILTKTIFKKKNKNQVGSHIEP